MKTVQAEPVVCIRHLGRRFDQKVALEDVSVEVKPGQVFGIVGENGAGKTTLIKHILGLYKAQAGTVKVFGNNPVAEPESTLSRIGYLSEEPDLPAWMKLSELLNYTAAFYQHWDHRYAKELIELFGLDLSSTVRTLSKGMRAQLGLVLAQAHRPDLLLLDEPSSGLDPNIRRDILAAIIRTVVDEGRTVIFSSHLLEEVQRVSDHLVMLRSGQLLLSASMDDVLNKHHRFTLRCSSAPNFIDGDKRVLRSASVGDEWQVDWYGNEHEFSRRAQACGVQIAQSVRLNLDEIFLVRSQAPTGRRLA
ncbi:MAG: ABC transporter ATP-binding protein [Lysobacterales bacterium]